jgi:hypothetical protein
MAAISEKTNESTWCSRQLPIIYVFLCFTLILSTCSAWNICPSHGKFHDSRGLSGCSSLIHRQISARAVHPRKLFNNEKLRSIPRMSASLSSSSFETWLDAHNVEHKALSLANFDGIRGVRAERDIGPGDTVLSVPLSACITDKSDPLHKISPTAWSKLPWQSRMALTLCMHRKMGKASPYHAYLASLPACPPRVPPRWTEQELQELQDPFLLTEVDGLVFWSYALYDDVYIYHNEGLQNCGTDQAGVDPLPSREDFLWALDMLQSRTIRVDPLSNQGLESGSRHARETEVAGQAQNARQLDDDNDIDDDDDDVKRKNMRALVPYLDMLNHDPHASTEFGLDSKGQQIQVRLCVVRKSRRVCAWIAH